MKKGVFVAQHLTISLTVLSILLGAVFLSFSLVRDVLMNPKKYFLTELSNAEIQFYITYISLVVTVVLISYIIYLLLSYNTRTELMVLNAIESIDKSREQFIKLYESAPVPYVILNKAGEIIDLNKAALRFFGTAAEGMKGKNLFSCQPEEDSEKTEKLFRYYKSNVPIDRQEVRMIVKSGTKWALLSVFEMKNFEGSEPMGLATIFDITEQKRLDQAKTEFVSLASHQLRTPVSTVKWYTDMLLSGNLGEFSGKQRDYLNIVYKVNEEMIDLIDTLLNVSRAETGSIKIDKKPTDVIELTESILVELSSQIEEKGINIDKQYNGNLKNIKSDPKMLRIVIQNLVSNAVRYTPPGGTVTVSLNDSFIEKSVTVSDTGIGIPSEEQNKIFTKLFRASNARNAVGSQGTGLGLYLVKSIIEAMGGNISFTSEEGKGSTFKIKL